MFRPMVESSSPAEVGDVDDADALNWNNTADSATDEGRVQSTVQYAEAPDTNVALTDSKIGMATLEGNSSKLVPVSRVMFIGLLFGKGSSLLV